MKRLRHSFFLILILSCTMFCEKQEQEPSPAPEREPTLPELIEKDLIGILGKDWKSLADTLHYFDSTMLRKGKTNGIAPDGNYYELDVRIPESLSLEVKFRVVDSVWINASGRIFPLDMNLRACDTDFSLRTETDDTTLFSTGKIQVRIPPEFLSEADKEAPLLYENKKVGYLKREEMENLDYTTGTYLIVRYYNDHRTFAFYEGGLAGLFNLSGIQEYFRQILNLPDKSESNL